MNLNRDFLKTLGGILIIGAIVVVTFLYGNQQRQNQIRKEEQAKEQSDQQAKKSATAKAGKSAKSKQGVGGGALPSTTPQTGGEVFWLVIPAAGVGVVSFKRMRARQGYSL